MSDIHVRKSGRDMFTVSSLTPTGFKWLAENMIDTVVTIQQEFIEEIKELIQKAGLSIEED